MSTIYTVRDNLKNTIAGKEKYLAEIELALPDTQGTSHHVLATMREFLKININELRVILFDVEKCCEEATLASWKENPDRMGGQFTEDEINDTGWH